MIYTKSQSDYVDFDANFQPLPKLGHFSRKHPAYEAAEEAIGAAFSQLYCLPDFESFRNAAGDIDAIIPPGGPDRYRDVTTQLMHFATRDGHIAELKVYKSPNVEPNAVLMYRMHGGAWCVGRHEVDGAENVYAATNKNIVVVSVDYRLAPENPFPRPLHDSYDGLLWCKQNANLLGVNPERIILSGSSAGANLAAALAIECRDNGVTGVIAQVLHFPATCHPKFFPKHEYEFGSYIQSYENPVLSTLRYEACLDIYVPHAVPDHRHSPLLAKSLKGLPPTLIQCAGADILRDEAFAYAEALQASGVDVEIYSYEGLPHCFPVILDTISETSYFYARYQKFLEHYSITSSLDP
ncbi:hypothetical protein N8I77_001344 [Diaporthe amygdali]|uniref:Alpha/beta hydrolase fold-3 domain-containing protein n=1 Tax=Phomopsis amygdali TaxID=1214568 RepID=A0AAD9SRG7_PHOAM|nr:hypothetical protein N8I77_001344 [Diaporthe amygdali]